MCRRLIAPLCLSSLVFTLGCGGATPVSLGPRAETVVTDTDTDASPSVPEPWNPWQDAPPSRAGQWPELQASLPGYALEVEPEDLQRLEDNIQIHSYAVPGRFTYLGRTYAVRVSFRGNHTRYLPKRSFQLRFDDERFLDRVRQLELLADWKDGGLLTQKLWWDLSAAAGLRVPRAQLVELTLNGKLHGVMVEVESVKKAFLRANAFDHGADIYRCGQRDCELRAFERDAHQKPWVKRTNEDQPWDELWEMIDGVNRTPPEDFPEFLERHFELDDLLIWLAVDAAIANYAPEDARSFFIYDREVARWTFVPWDFNNSLALYNRTNGLHQGTQEDRPLMTFTPYDPMVYQRWAEDRAARPELKPTWSTLVTRVVDDPGLRARMVGELEELLETRFRIEELGPRIDHYHRLLAPHLARDPWIAEGFAEASGPFLRRFVERRREWLLDNLETLKRHGETSLVIDSVGVDPSGEVLVELYNRGQAPQSLGGMSLTGIARVHLQAPLPDQTLAPGASLTLRAHALDGFVLDPARPEVALYAADGTTAVDVVFLPALERGEAYGRTPRGSEHFAPKALP